MISDDDLNAAIDRIARTEDGQLLYRYLQRVLIGVVDGPTVTDYMLRIDQGRRIFARDLMARMAQGIEDSAGRDTPNRPVVFSVRAPARAASGPNVRQWLTANDPELAALRARGNGAGPGET